MCPGNLRVKCDQGSRLLTCGSQGRASALAKRGGTFCARYRWASRDALREAHRAWGTDSPRHSACPYAASRIPGSIAYLAPWTEYRVPNVATRYRVYVGLPE